MGGVNGASDGGNGGGQPDALEVALAALEAQRSRHGEDHDDTASRCLDVAFALAESASHPASLEYRQRALAIRQRVLGGEHPDTGLVWGHVGHSLGKLGRHDEALEAHQRALAIHEIDDDPGAATLARDHFSVASALIQLSRLDEARRHLRRCLRFGRGSLGAIHPLCMEATRALKTLERGRKRR
jgi:eukaryotic-like serine/threonine-protein kinase